MPIEIRELVIKTTVNQEKGKKRKAEPEEGKEDIIAECLERVANMIKYEKGR